ncbi:hypothetical protein C2845_PM17G07040 [Panicum miliaceum]|uniref:Uncharacterized protein n=1 Tax=Panicum miliaceum TaxID=4540 RepID=A0A3L6Q6E1_PANMI|nr:hypothetical protein C2845_PM17G07040 [Panicum miliaceum]
MDDDDAPYLDLRDDRERKAYTILKNQSFGHSKAFDPDLLANTVVHGKFAPRCNDIQNPTLRLMHKWLAITLFPRDDVRTVRNHELMILYAMVNKNKVSPVKSMISQWLSNFKMTGPIECTSLVTRIASSLGVLDGNAIPYIEDPQTLIDKDYLIYGHTLKKGPNDSLIFFSLGYENKIPLPNAGYHLYNCQSLTAPLIPEEVARRHSVSGLPARMTRNKARRGTEPAPLPQQPQPSHHHEAGGSAWHSASTDEWARQALSRRSTSSSSSGIPNLPRRTASSRDFGSITQQLGELRVQADNIEYTLHQHIETNQAWQQYTGDRIHVMEQRQLQQQEEWRVSYRWRGFNPDQQ